MLRAMNYYFSQVDTGTHLLTSAILAAGSSQTDLETFEWSESFQLVSSAFQAMHVTYSKVKKLTVPSQGEHVL